MSKKFDSNEIDLVEAFIIIWKKKFHVFSFVILALILTYASQLLFKADKRINATTEIRPITVYDEAKYKIYNSIINTIKPYYVKEGVSKITAEAVEKIDRDYKIVKTEVKDLEISNIGKEFLLNLFVDRLNERSNLVNSIKKFNLVKLEDYSDKLEYENAVANIASSVTLLNIDDINDMSKKKTPVMIQYTGHELKNWEEFLKFIEKDTNIEIHKKLSEMFTNYMNYVEAIKIFEIEDIETQLSVTKDENEKLTLQKKKSILNANKYVERMMNIFASSPISSSEEFYAAKIIFDSTHYKSVDYPSISLKLKYFLSALLGAVVGIFFVLIANAVKKRS